MSLPIEATPPLKGRDAERFVDRFLHPEKRPKAQPVDAKAVARRVRAMLRQTEINGTK